ncbi:MAG: hypothetical protein FWC50_14410, partial [Planctomycetaceae bacterium]|nr:hypothetical protein [Planctomycetaceae bacterium]
KFALKSQISKNYYKISCQTTENNCGDTFAVSNGVKNITMLKIVIFRGDILNSSTTQQSGH